MNAGSTFSPHTFVVWLLTILIVGTLAVAACGGGEATGGPSPIAVSSSPITAASPSPTASTTPSAAGPRPAVSCALPPGLPSPHAITLGTVGWEFKPTVDIKVTDLGCFDVYQDGLALSHRVGILDEETSRLLATVTVRPKSPLDGVFRWESLAAPVVLRAGHSYLVGTEDHQKTHIAARTAEKVEPLAHRLGVCETCYHEANAGEWAPEVTFVELRQSGKRGAGRFTAPTNPDEIWAFVKVAWMSPNFKFVPLQEAAPSPAMP